MKESLNQASAMAQMSTCSPLIRRLIEECGFPLLGAAELDAFLRQEPETVTVLFFPEDARKYPESNDVAVVLPELVKHFGGRLRAAVISRQDEKALQQLYGFQQWPALVFVRGQTYLGSICKIQDWEVYLERIEKILQNKSGQSRGIGIPVVTAAGQDQA